VENIKLNSNRVFIIHLDNFPPLFHDIQPASESSAPRVLIDLGDNLNS
jgi:hypothetical protein